MRKDNIRKLSRQYCEKKKLWKIIIPAKLLKTIQISPFIYKHCVCKCLHTKLCKSMNFRVYQKSLCHLTLPIRTMDNCNSLYWAVMETKAYKYDFAHCYKISQRDPLTEC